ncbi:hypothetical protein AKJ63_00085 [candidate division MSBL1 archaeon SCGC-AAA259D18]|uniref:Fibronectin type-III domain-containing protein n=1 Tax=candidate division MSBL1 archaeon SCGC-AAA259D18 TaxID=1698262 RepID=A0A133UCU4_9EURY|nr:hypothetical protein AKJ63_00085 [candidate division MSBL1 archaeon SCGC-AAA259D18]
MESSLWPWIGEYYGRLEVEPLDRNGDSIEWLAFIVNGEVVENNSKTQEEPHHYTYENQFDTNTTYHWKVQAKDSFGEVSTSETETFTTGGGCPYLYGWNGDSYKLINATMPQPILKRYETTSYQEAGILKSRDGYYDLNLFQKLPEKAWINNLSLKAVDHPKGTEVLTDQTCRIYTIADPQPVTATDEEGRDITNLLENQDQKYWTSDLEGRNFENLDDLVDHVTLTLPERSNSRIKLIVRGRQTFLAELSLWSVYHYILGTPNFGYITGLLENDAPSSLGSAFDNAFGRFSSIRLQYWNGKEWIDFRRIGILKAFFERTVVPIDLSKIPGKRIRLSMSAGLYDIDQILVEYSQARTMISRTLEPVQAVKYGEEGSENVLKKVSKVDNRYAIIRQGEYIDYKFRQMDPPENGMTRTFVLPTGGYYYLTGPEVPENRIYNLPLAENLACNPYSFEAWILSRYAYPENYPYTEYFQMSTANPPFQTSR